MNFRYRVAFILSIAVIFTACDSSRESSIKMDNMDNIEQDIVSTSTAIVDDELGGIAVSDDNISSPPVESVDDEVEENITIDGVTEEPIDNSFNGFDIYPTPEVSEDINDSSNSIQNSHVDDNTDIKSRFLKGCSQVVDKEFFEVCYSYDLKVAKAVIYRLEGDLVNELNIKERPKFYEEEQLPQEYRAEYSDYTHSGYDRGHMAPDASFDWSIESLEATYSMANIIPQVPEVNRYGWANLEQYVRDMAVELGYVDVINVVEYGDDVERIGENKIGVSSGYYKILSNGDENYRECFYYENEEPQTDADSVERHRVDCSIVR